MHELDEFIQHAGVKGMKWGVRKKITQVSKKIDESNQRLHDKKMSKSKKYQKTYAKHLKKTKGDAAKAQNLSVDKHRAKQLKRVERAIKLTPAAVAAGKIIVSGVRSAATSPQAIRAGKNIVQAMKGSPLRYVDGASMKNVIN